jgi:hypothetical protein
MDDFDLRQEMRVAGRESALRVILSASGGANTLPIERRATLHAAAVDQQLQREMQAQRLQPEWVAGTEDILQALLRIADRA